MRNIYSLVMSAALLGCSELAAAQEILSDSAQALRQQTDPKELANPSVIGMGRSKGVVVRYEMLPRFGLRSEGKREDIGNSETEVRRNNKFEIKAYIPILNRPHFKMVVGAGYFLEEFNFKQPEGLEYPLYKQLQDKDLRSLDGQLIMLKPFNEKNYLLVRVKGELNGDYGKDNDIPLHKYLKTSVEAIYGWKKSPLFSYGFGVQLGYTFGRQSIYPAVLYNRTFNDRWGIESIFPANLTVRRNLSDKSLLFAGYKVEGASYNITVSPPFQLNETVELRKSEIRARLRWEREIYDFIWFGLEGGYRYNHRFDVYDGENVNANPLIESHIKDAAFLQVDLFLVPPRRFLKQ
ncbi:hypothetical protein GU926_14480 [Nibribacter ruber]|uniref:DUF6268 domain-containing protein n=1 Tax=Nibribacter ruber TaxID=2698458 RepID=A0A6P1P2H4_9BACT|nr:DUF6268 family outer membrane beta-barrel protein [Nibribacter ruber]QHL88572.1 hypothetical protein GU926_14480 [Nibribacter ruber]